MENRYIHIHQELIDACRAGHRNAQYEIYKRYYKAMYNTSLRIVNNSAEAEDIMQESFLDAFQRLDSYKALVVVVGELQDAVQNLARQQIYLQGELDAARKRQGIKAPFKTVSDFKSEVTLSTLPTDLTSALKSQGKFSESRIMRLTPLPPPACP